MSASSQPGSPYPPPQEEAEQGDRSVISMLKQSEAAQSDYNSTNPYTQGGHMMNRDYRHNGGEGMNQAMQQDGYNYHYSRGMDDSLNGQPKAGRKQLDRVQSRGGNRNGNRLKPMREGSYEEHMMGAPGRVRRHHGNGEEDHRANNHNNRYNQQGGSNQGKVYNRNNRQTNGNGRNSGSAFEADSGRRNCRPRQRDRSVQNGYYTNDNH